MLLVGFLVHARHGTPAGKALVKQHRERILIIGFGNRVFHKIENFNFPETTEEQSPKLKDILQDKADDKYTLSDKLWNYLKNHAITHKKQKTTVLVIHKKWLS